MPYNMSIYMCLCNRMESSVPKRTFTSKCVTSGRQFCIHSNSSPPGQNNRHFGSWQFQLHFLELRMQNYDRISLKFVLRKAIDNKPAFGSGNGLVPKRRHGDVLLYNVSGLDIVNRIVCFIGMPCVWEYSVWSSKLSTDIADEVSQAQFPTH